MSTNLERARRTLAHIKDVLDDIHAHATRRRAQEVDDNRDDTQEARERLLERQEETERELERAEKLLEQLIDEGDDDEESDQEIRLVERIEDLERELRKRQEDITRLWQRQQRQGDRFRRLDELAKNRARRQNKLERRKHKVLRRIEEIKEAQQEDETGTGPWGGSMSIVEQEVVPIMNKYGPITSRKRSETYGNPTSDHHISQTTAYAADCGIAERHDVLDEIARAVVGRNVSDYENVYFTRAGKQFRFQGIAGTHGTGPHCHVGVRLA